MFTTTFDQLKEVDAFFRQRHAPRCAYEANVERLSGTHLHQPAETRWGSNVDMGKSILKNHHIIDGALADLRSGRF